jgi:uncharacterized protein (DUF433 family)
MNWRDRVSLDPQVLGGKPTVRGTRIAVELIFERLADGWTRDDLTSSYPRVSDDDLRAAFAFAAELIRQRRDWVPEQTA